MILGRSDSSGSASTSTPYLGGHFARLCLRYSCTLPASTWATAILVFGFWFRLWSMAKYSYRFWNGRLICLWPAFVGFLFGISKQSPSRRGMWGGFWLYLRINIYLLCYFRRFIRALHASANGIRAARIVSAIVGHRSSSPA